MGAYPQKAALEGRLVAGINLMSLDFQGVKQVMTLDRNEQESVSLVVTELVCQAAVKAAITNSYQCQ